MRAFFATLSNLHARIQNILASRWVRWASWLFLAAMVGLFYGANHWIQDEKQRYFWMLMSVLGVFVNNFAHCLRLRRRFVFLLFNITLFVFLLIRPLTDTITDYPWYRFGEEANVFNVLCLLVSQIALRIGSEVGEFLRIQYVTKRMPSPVEPTQKKLAFRKKLQLLSLLLYALAMLFYGLSQGEKLIYMEGRSYEEFYLFQSQLPFYVHTLAAMTDYALCLFLATLPRKGPAFAALCVYVLSDVPTFLLGVRAPIVLDIIFALVYFLLRDALGSARPWVGRLEKAAMAIGAPIGMAVLGLVNYIRDSQQAAFGFLDLIIDFLYKQSVSFNVLARGYNALSFLPGDTARNFTFGPFIDYICHGTIAQKLFGAVSLGSSNSEFIATYGHSFSHSMSFVAHPQYLEGQGWGSSYLLETYADWGYVGIFVFSLLLGLLFAWIVSIAKTNTLTCTIALVALTGLFFIPRGEATGWLLFLCTFQFWLVILACYGGAWVLTLLEQIHKKQKNI